MKIVLDAELKKIKALQEKFNAADNPRDRYGYLSALMSVVKDIYRSGILNTQQEVYRDAMVRDITNEK